MMALTHPPSPGMGVIRQYGCRDDDDSESESEHHHPRGLFGIQKKRHHHHHDEFEHSDDDGSVCSKASVASRASQAMKNLGGKLFGGKKEKKEYDAPPLALSGMMIGGGGEHHHHHDNEDDLSDPEYDPLDASSNEYFRKPPQALRQPDSPNKQKHAQQDDSDDESVLASVGRGLRKAGGTLKKTLGKAAVGSRKHEHVEFSYGVQLESDDDEEEEDHSDLSSDSEDKIIMGAMDRSGESIEDEEQQQPKRKQKRGSKLRIPALPSRKCPNRTQSDHGHRRKGRRHSDQPRKRTEPAQRKLPARSKSMDEKAPSSADRRRGGRRPSKGNRSRDGKERRHCPSGSEERQLQDLEATATTATAKTNHQARWQIAQQMTGNTTGNTTIIASMDGHRSSTAGGPKWSKLGELMTQKHRSSRSSEETPVWAMNVSEQMLLDAQQ